MGAFEPKRTEIPGHCGGIATGATRGLWKGGGRGNSAPPSFAS